jgi:hypothetical protein
MKTPLWAPFFLLFISPLFARDPYDAWPALPRLPDQPRVLNTEDVPDLKLNNAQELVTLEGDFNHDASSDMAVSGIYDLPQTGNKFFLVIATFKANQPVSLFYREFEMPVFLHAAGSTGSGDPKTQAFSYSFCWDCDNGYDVKWVSKLSRFETVRWEKRKAPPVVTPTPIPEVPESLVDEALKIVGVLPDVQTYVSALQKKNGKLGTRVEWDSVESQRVWVSIFEKNRERGIVVWALLSVGERKESSKASANERS